jgi:hypothetical protein
MNTGDKIAMGLLMAVLCAGIAAYAKQTSDFKQACEERGGKTVHNGRNWECLK